MLMPNSSQQILCLKCGGILEFVNS